MSAKWSTFAMRLVVSLCFCGEAIFAKHLHQLMSDFTFVHYRELGDSKFELFPIQDGLEILYRGLFVLSLLWLFLALKTLFRLTRHAPAA